MKYRKGITITNTLQNILDKSGRKPNKLWVDKGKGSKFYDRSMKPWLQDNNTEMYSAHNEGKSVVIERFMRTLKKKINKYMTLISKNAYVDKLEDIVNKCNNIYHSKIKMKLVDVNSRDIC